MGMSPKLPQAPAFRLLSDLNDYMSLSPDERQAALADYVAATEQRKEALEKIRKNEAAASADRNTASQVLGEATQTAKQTRQVAADDASQIMTTARKQAEDVNKKMLGLRNTLADMRTTGLPAIDLTQVYFDVSETVYRDMCCHLNERGNAIMAEAIVSAIINERSQSSVAD